ncbi:Hypothetical predicted protein [Paramuricea clavata]|uniref:Reverse transcriptase/retrotransposon-derived protein RNase H-like domain-containing protein n=1 Tax=Paramuricea clavata TaxID=317549 RepID=A0A7D9HH33_PARCT|nr:Hypothetical predicted protein [Paramuricea clavata]
MEADGVIEKVDQPTEWVNSVVVMDLPRPQTIKQSDPERGLQDANHWRNMDLKLVTYASRALTDAETRYTQIEKELLAVVFGFEKELLAVIFGFEKELLAVVFGFEKELLAVVFQYTYSRPMEVKTDRKPLEAITKKPLSMAPPRLQRIYCDYIDMTLSQSTNLEKK